MASASANPSSGHTGPPEKRRMHPLLRKLHTNYMDMADGKPLPKSEGIDPAAFSWLNGCFSTLSVLPREHDYRFDLCGRHMRLFCGHDITEHRLSEMEGRKEISDIRKDLDLVVLARRPRYSSGSMIWEDGLRLDCEWLILPFTGSHGRISTLLVAEMAHPAPGSRTPIPLHLRTFPRLEMHAMIWPAFHRRVSPHETRPHGSA